MFLFFIQQETAITSRTWAPTLTWRRLTWTAQRTSSSSPVTASGTPWRRRKPPTASSLNCARIKVWTGLLKMGQSRPLFVYSHPFSHYNFNNTNWEMCWWCAWDLNPGPQDGRRRRNHGAMAAAHGVASLRMVTKTKESGFKMPKNWSMARQIGDLSLSDV